MSQDQGFRVPLTPVAQPPSTNGSHAPVAQEGQPPVALPPVMVREASAPRRWTPKGLALAVILVVLGGLLVVIGLQHFAQRDAVLVVSKPVPAGSRITGADLTTAKITTDAAIKPISSADRDEVIGKFAMVDLVAGSTLTRSEVGPSDGFTRGQVLVPLPLKQGQMPARGLSPGQQVIIVSAPSGDGSSSTGSSSSSAPATNATVAEVGAANASTGITVVDVRVPAAASVGLAQLAATGNATVLLLPPGR